MEDPQREPLNEHGEKPSLLAERLWTDGVRLQWRVSSQEPLTQAAAYYAAEKGNHPPLFPVELVNPDDGVTYAYRFRAAMLERGDDGSWVVAGWLYVPGWAVAYPVEGSMRFDSPTDHGTGDVGELP